MTADIVSIERKTEQLISSYPENPLSNKEVVTVNLFLDRINKIRKPLVKATDILKKIDKLLLSVTWVEVKNEDDENKVKEILNLTKSFHKTAIRDYAFLHKKLPKNMFGEALHNFKCSIDDFEDSISEVQNVIFDLRKDNELMDMIELL